MEKLHRMVNGIRIELTEEEEKEIKAEWEKGKIESIQLKKEYEDKQLKIQNIKLKLNSLGFSDEEINLFKFSM